MTSTQPPGTKHLGTIRMFAAMPLKRARAVQPGVHQRVDGDHRSSSGDPALTCRVAGQQ